MYYTTYYLYRLRQRYKATASGFLYRQHKNRSSVPSSIRLSMNVTADINIAQGSPRRALHLTGASITHGTLLVLPGNSKAHHNLRELSSLHVTRVVLPANSEGWNTSEASRHVLAS
jgi:hypothetical protein